MGGHQPSLGSASKQRGYVLRQAGLGLQDGLGLAEGDGLGEKDVMGEGVAGHQPSAG